MFFTPVDNILSGKKLFLLIPIVTLWSFLACEKEEVKDLNYDVKFTGTTRHQNVLN